MSSIFINNLNSPVGLLMLDELRPIVDGEPSPIRIVCTLDPAESTPRPEGVKKRLHRHKPRLFKKYLLSCDVIIYDLHTADLKEVEEKLSIFKTAKLEESKIIIIISSVMVWANTPEKKQLAPQIEENPDANLENQDKPEDPKGNDLKDGSEDKNEEIPKVEESKSLPFEEADYSSRVPHKEYAGWKAIEDLALGLASKENLSVYIICAGILYGNGETVFESHFKSAWLESPAKLPYVGTGNNLIPTVHVKDLAKVTKFVVDTKPETKYILAIDNTKDRKQVSLIQAISHGIGTGYIESSPLSGKPWEQFMSINLWMKPSAILVPEDETPAPIEWHSLDGIPGNIYKLNNEFNAKRGLRPIKVFVSGPPAAGKTHFSKLVAAEYNIPHIKIKELLHECSSKHPELGPKIDVFLNSNSRVPSDLLSEVFQWKLHMNHCRNRGFILDGYPRTFEEAQQLCRKEKKLDEPPAADEDQEPKPKEYELDSEILPQSVVVFRASSVFLLNRIERLKDKHQEFNLERMERRMHSYKHYNELSDRSVFDFYSDQNIEIFECKCDDEEIEIMEELKIYIERDGRPYNFLPSVQEMVENRKNFMEERDLKKVKEEQKRKELDDKVKAEARANRERLASERLLRIRDELSQATQPRSLPLRKYLMENIMPSLAEALIQVCKVMPEDPVDFVAEAVWAQSKKFR